MNGELDKIGVVLAIVVNQYKRALLMWRSIAAGLLILCLLLATYLVMITADNNKSNTTALALSAPVVTVGRLAAKTLKKEGDGIAKAQVVNV